MTSLTETMLDSLTNEYAATRDSFNRDDLVHLLCDLRELRAGLAEFTKDVERDLLAHADETRWITPGLGAVEIKRSIRYSEWDNDGLTRRLVALALDERRLDEETGEYEPAWEAVARVLSEASRPSWRVTPLRARGIDVDEYCHIEPQAWSIKLPPSRVDVSPPK